ncbi:MAG: iron-containing redox enzyme family protein [Nocardioidaceae bacterium]|nr:iron-containing redox enzyme family protein [Nocardioidaceae bacterium]
MLLPSPRGTLGAALVSALRGDGPVPATGAHDDEDDLQLSLWVLYELHYRGFDDVPGTWEWDPELLRLRAALEAGFEAAIRERCAGLVTEAEEQAGEQDDVVTALRLIAEADVPALSSYLHRTATAEQYREFLMARSVYHLKESDPHSWAVPRLTGAPKAALAELQYDELGGGRPDRVHQQLFADALTEAGLDPAYGSYVDLTPAPVLAVNNAMSLFGLHRRLVGACVGHLAAFEMTSSLPCRRYAQGAERLELGPAVVRYFDEHVEADAVHEHLAARDICARLVDQQPALRADVLLGAAACVLLEADAARATLDAWEQGLSALRAPEQERVA